MTDQFIGVGMTHYPLLAGQDEDMAGLLRWTLEDPDIPAEEKNPARWPASMREEWGVDEGAGAAAQHREQLVTELRRLRASLDAFQPDLVIVWGDDQYENFREEVVPPFCVLAYGDVEVEPFALMNERHSPNAWGLPDDLTITLPGDAEESRWLANALVSAGFDMAYSYIKRPQAHFPHAILNTQLFLDYDQAGRQMRYPFIPITVNCYGEHAIARKGGLARFAEIQSEQLDPTGPTPRRCYELGAGVARAFKDRGKRVAFVGSSSWSHAFLTDKTWHLRPDTEADKVLYKAMAEGDRDTWLKVTSREIVDAGQHEMLNWYCLLGAVDELGLDLSWSSLITTNVFNSSKCFALFQGSAA